MGKLRDDMEAILRLRNSSERTSTGYVTCVRKLAAYYNRRPDQLSLEQVRGYLVHRKEVDGVSPSTVKLYAFAFRFFYRPVSDGHISTSTAQAIVKRARRGAKITRRITIHSLRHAYATHQLEDGADVRFVQQVLGHGRLETTARYLHVCDGRLRHAASPLDRLDVDSNPSNV